MKIRLFALVAVLSVAGLSSARAGDWGADCRHGAGWGGGAWGGQWNYHDHAADFCKKHGVKFSHGFFYVGLPQKHFTEKWYDWRLETWLYMDPHARSPYYWCEGHGVWYPVRYIREIGPGAKGPGPVVAGGGPGGPPPEGVAGGVPNGGPGVTPVAPLPGGQGGAPATQGKGAVQGQGPVQGQGAGQGQGAVPGKTPAPPTPGAQGVGDAPLDLTSTDAGTSLARSQSVAQRDIPPGTFDDAIPETK